MAPTQTTRIDISKVPQQDKPKVLRFAQLAARRAALSAAVAAAGKQDIKRIRAAERPYNDCVQALADLRAQARGYAAKAMDDVARLYGDH